MRIQFRQKSYSIIIFNVTIAYHKADNLVDSAFTTEGVFIDYIEIQKSKNQELATI
jgi:hypothetical protein